VRTHINRYLESGERNLQRKAIRRRQLWKGYDHIGEMVMATWMGERPYCEMSGGVPTIGGQAGQAAAVVVAEEGVIAIRGWVAAVG
jgi:hypothetical protein